MAKILKNTNVQLGNGTLDESAFNEFNNKIKQQFEFTGSKGGVWGSGEGYIKDPTTGIITQWKQDEITLSSGEGTKATSLPISFPNALLGAVISMNALNDVDSLELPKITHSVHFFNRQAGQVRLKHSSLGANYKITYTVIAIGY